MLYQVMLILVMVIVLFEIVWLVNQTGYLFLLFVTSCIQEFTKGLSIIGLDSGQYNLELNNYTYFSNAGLVYYIYLSIFYLLINVFVLIVNLYFKKSCIFYYPYSDKRYNIIYIVGYIGVTYLFLDMIISGIPLLSGGNINRYNFWADYSKLPLAKYVSLMLTIICVALGFKAASQKILNTKNRNWLYLFALILVARMFLGYKASGLVDLIIGFSIGYFYRICAIERRRSIVKLFAYIVAIYIILVVFFAVTQIISGKYDNFYEAIQGIFYRAVSTSGHMEWSVFSDPGIANSWWINDSSELLSIFRGDDDMDPHIGVYGLMDRYAPSETFTLYFDKKIRFASGFIGVSAFYNGRIITVLICVINAIIISAFYYVFKKIALRNMVYTFSMLYYVYNIFSTYLDGSGTLTSFYNINTYLYLLFILIIYFFEKKYLRKNNCYLICE